MTGRQGTEALTFARRKPSSGPPPSGLTPQDRRNDLELLAAAVRAALPVDVEQPTIFVPVIHLKTAGALGAVMPPSPPLRADEVIE